MTNCSLQTATVFLRGGGFERLPPLLRSERLGELFEVALDDAIEPLDRQVDPVVRDAVVRIVVGADLLGPVTPADLRAARGGELLLLALTLELEQARAEDAQRLGLVLKLRFLVLHRHDEAGRQVGDANGRVSRVHALAPWPGRAVDVDLEVVRVDLDLDLLGLGDDGDRRRRGVDSSLGLRHGHALYPMRASLPLENGIRAVALDRERDVVVAAALARIGTEHLPLEAPVLRVAGEHAEEIARPDRRLVAPGALANLDDYVLLVVGVALDERELELVLELFQPPLELGNKAAEFRVLARRLEVVASRTPLLRELVRALELFQPAARIGRGMVVGEDRRVAHPLLRVGEGALELVDEAVHLAHGVLLRPLLRPCVLRG